MVVHACTGRHIPDRLPAREESIKQVRPGNVVGRRVDQRCSDISSRTSTRSHKGRIAAAWADHVERDDEYRVWFMHGTSHWLGMNVHDVGDYTTPLAPGMVLTVEPGIYIHPDALDVLPETPEMEKFKRAVRPAFEKYKGVGVRIEDDILVTAGEPRNLSAAIPRSRT